MLLLGEAVLADMFLQLLQELTILQQLKVNFRGGKVIAVHGAA